MVWDDIDWEAFHIAARTYSSTKVHLLKLVHDQLPFRTHTARFQPWTTSHCHYCDHPDTMDHLQCSDCNPTSGPFREQLKSRLTIFMDSRRCSRLISGYTRIFPKYWPHPQSTPVRQTSDGACSLEGFSLSHGVGYLRSDTTMIGNPMEPTRRQMNSAESTPILARIIKTILTSLSELWLSHLAHIHTKSEHTLSPITTAELHRKVHSTHNCIRLTHTTSAMIWRNFWRQPHQQQSKHTYHSTLRPSRMRLTSSPTIRT